MSEAHADFDSAQRGTGREAIAADVAPGPWAVRLAELAVEWSQRDGVQETINAVTADALDTIPGAEAAFIVRPTGDATGAFSGATGPEALSAARLERAEGGPSSTALADNAVVQMEHIATDERWPEYSTGVTDLGLASMLAVPMEMDGRTIGTLAVFSQQVNAFGDNAVAGTALYAEQGAVALNSAQNQSELSEAVQRRDVIGRAKGILMERHRLTDEQAFEVLVQASQNTNVPLRDIAKALAGGAPIPKRPTQ